MKLNIFEIKDVKTIDLGKVHKFNIELAQSLGLRAYERKQVNDFIPVGMYQEFLSEAYSENVKEDAKTGSSFPNLEYKTDTYNLLPVYDAVSLDMFDLNANTIANVDVTGINQTVEINTKTEITYLSNANYVRTLGLNFNASQYEFDTYQLNGPYRLKNYFYFDSNNKLRQHSDLYLVMTKTTERIIVDNVPKMSIFMPPTTEEIRVLVTEAQADCVKVNDVLLKIMPPTTEPTAFKPAKNVITNQVSIAISTSTVTVSDLDYNRISNNSVKNYGFTIHNEDVFPTFTKIIDGDTVIDEDKLFCWGVVKSLNYDLPRQQLRFDGYRNVLPFEIKYF